MAKDISKNFEKQINRKGVKKPDCFSKFEATSKVTPKKCGTCWFNPFCRAGKLPETKKEEKKATK